MAVVSVWMLSAAGYAYATTPDQFLLASHFGLEVNKTKTEAGASQQERDVCTVSSGDHCQPGKEDEAGTPGGFHYPGSVAVNSHGDVYVAEGANRRIQELSRNGVFIAMFGWNVDKTKVGEGAAQRERDICTAVSNDECQPGEEGSGTGLPEELGHVRSIAIDQSTNDVYVLTPLFHRVEMLTEDGEFVWMAGQEVNETKDNTPGTTEAEKNLCTAASGDVCKVGAESSAGSKAPDTFKISENEENFGNLLAVGVGDLLYAADEGRVQKISSSGHWEGEVSLSELSSTEAPSAVAVDLAGDVFVGDPASPGVHEYNSAGQLQSKVIGPSESGTHVDGLALDAYGRLGILSEEFVGSNNERQISGLLYNTSDVKISSFAPPGGSIEESHSLAFASVSAPLPDELYIPEALGSRQEIEAYEPVVAPTVTTLECPQPTGTSEKLCGEVNPNGTQTIGFFQYGTTKALGSQTPSAFEGSGSTFAPMSFEVAGLEPNQQYFYTAAAETTFNGRKIVVTGNTIPFSTPPVSQQVVGHPEASFVTTQTAVLSASLNPEHSSTGYYFQYGPCASLANCSGVHTTPFDESEAYGVIEDIAEIVGLASYTLYAFRLVTERAGENPIYGPEETFTTPSMSTPVLKASAGPSANERTATGATLIGNVDPGGQPAIYRFEMGIYNGASTQFSTVAMGSTGTAETNESAHVSDLQPGLTYAYRITVASGYGSATSVPAIFETLALPAVITEPTLLPMLAVPKIAFPKPAAKPQAKCRRGFRRDKQGKCVKTKRHHHAKKKSRRGKK